MKKIWKTINRYGLGVRKLVIYSIWLWFLYTFFFLTYMPINRINAARSDHLHLYFQWETHIPVIPDFMLVYASIVLAFGLPLFMIKLPEIHLMGFRFLAMMIVSNIIFLLIPTTTGFPREVPGGILHGIFGVLYFADKPYNLFPSLHVAFSAILTISLGKNKAWWIRVIMWVWLVLLCVSVLVVHQHHLADIVGGVVLAMITMKMLNKVPRFFWVVTEKIYGFFYERFIA